MTFQERLRFYREKAGYKSAKEFAEKLGMGYTTYVAYENKDREPRYEVLCKIARLLDVTPNDLLGFTEKDELQRYIDLCNQSEISTELITTNDGSIVRVRPVGRASEGLFYDFTNKEFFEIIKSALNSPEYKSTVVEIEDYAKSVRSVMLNKYFLKSIVENMRKTLSEEEKRKIDNLEKEIRAALKR